VLYSFVARNSSGRIRYSPNIFLSGTGLTYRRVNFLYLHVTSIESFNFCFITAEKLKSLTGLVARGKYNYSV
jgi:hypothetical protein